MANKTVIDDKIQTKRINALNTCMKVYGVSNADLHKAGCGSPGEITYFTQGKRTLTDYVMMRIYDNVFKSKGVRKEYLLGFDDLMTDYEYQKYMMEYRTAHQIDEKEVEEHVLMSNACMRVIEFALNEVCKKEGIPAPNINTPEGHFLSLQLQDEAQKIVWAYLHSDTTPLWSYIKNFRPPLQ